MKHSVEGLVAISLFVLVTLLTTFIPCSPCLGVVSPGHVDGWGRDIIRQAAKDGGSSPTCRRYRVSATVAGGHGTVYPPTQEIERKGKATIYIKADDGYHTASIFDNGAPKAVADPYVINKVKADHTVVVTFAIGSHKVDASVSGGHGTVSPPTQNVDYGGTATVDLHPATGYHADSITDNGTPQTVTDPYVINDVTVDHTVVVTFAIDNYTVDASVSGGHGTVSPSTQNVDYEGTATVDMHPATGYHTASIFDNGVSETVTDTYVINNVTVDHTVEVTFAIDSHTVDASVSGGHGTVSPSTQSVDYGGTATVDMRPATGYHADSITDNGTPQTVTDPYVINNVTADHTVVVTFAIDSYTVDASVSGGHGTVSPSTQNVDYGGTATIDINPATGYHTASIFDNGVLKSVADPYVIKDIKGNHTVVVTLKIDRYTVDASVVGGHGSVLPRRQKVGHEGVAVVDIHANPDYGIQSITDNGALQPVADPYVINDITADHTVVVTFGEALPNSTWYLAEGSTAWGFSTYISIENPLTDNLNARITYMKTDGTTSGLTVGLPPLSQVTVNPADTLGSADFSTKVACIQGRTIAVDRTMIWTGKGAPSPEAHSSIGVTSPNKTWYLAEGSTAWGFECWLLIQNPNDQTANCQVTYMIEGQGPQTFNKPISPKSRATFDVSNDIGAKDASIQVASDVPVIPERSMYRNNRREGSESIGTTAPATDYYLGEGTTAWGFTDYVLVQNPNKSPTDVTITYLTPGGPREQPTFTMTADSRETIRVNDVKRSNGYPIDVSNTDVSTRVHGSQPIIAERAMYWGANTPLGEACHDSIGMDSAHINFYLPDGQTSEGRETYTLVANPNDSAVDVQVSYLEAGGTSNASFVAEVPANSRVTFNMADKIPNARASIMVTCLTPDMDVMVERSMYWNHRGAGTDTIGGYSD